MGVGLHVLGHQLAGPGRTAVRLMLFALMLAGLVLSTSIPKAFGTRGLAFAGAYVVMQVGRCLFTLWACRRATPASIATSSASAAGCARPACSGSPARFADGNARLGLWVVALVMEYVSPSVGFWTPRLGAFDHRGLGHRGRPHGRALRSLHHHRARRVDPRHRRQVRQAALDADDGRGLPHRLRRQRGDVVDLFQYRRRDGEPAHRRFERPGPARAHRLHLPASAAGGGHHRRGGRRRAGARASRPATPTSRPPPSCSAAPRSICSATHVQARDGEPRRCRTWSGLVLLALLAPVSLAFVSRWPSARRRRWCWCWWRSGRRCRCAGRRSRGWRNGKTRRQRVEQEECDAHVDDGGGRPRCARRFSFVARPARQSAADGARVFIWPWLAASLVNMLSASTGPTSP